MRQEARSLRCAGQRLLTWLPCINSLQGPNLLTPVAPCRCRHHARHDLCGAAALPSHPSLAGHPAGGQLPRRLWR